MLREVEALLGWAQVVCGNLKPAAAWAVWRQAERLARLCREAILSARWWQLRLPGGTRLGSCMAALRAWLRGSEKVG